MRPVIANRRPGSGSIDSTIPSSEIHRAIAPSLTANFPFLLTLLLALATAAGCTAPSALQVRSRQQGNARRSEGTKMLEDDRTSREGDSYRRDVATGERRSGSMIV